MFLECSELGRFAGGLATNDGALFGCFSVESSCQKVYNYPRGNCVGIIGTRAKAGGISPGLAGSQTYMGRTVQQLCRSRQLLHCKGYSR